MMLVATWAVLTDGETPLLVSIRDCTIHGWRPFSVSSQPDVLIRNGRTAAQTATGRNQRAPRATRSPTRRLRYSSHSPQSPITSSRLAR